MNEEDVRLLQAAAGSGGDGNESVSTVVGDVVVEQLSVDNLSVEQINHALQSLVNTMRGEVRVEEIGQQQPSPPQPGEFLTTTTITTTTNNDNNNSGPGSDTSLNTTGDTSKLWGIRGGQNGQSVTGGGTQDRSDIDYEIQLADLQRSLEELSHPATRANTSPSTKSPTEQNQMSPGLVARADQDTQMIAFEQKHHNVSPSPDATRFNERSRGRQLSVVDPSEDPLKAAEKERIRVENRERKKKWRNQNQERNKDNDLRCRVTKRALHLYGPDMSTEKSNWIEREFHRRRSKRVTRTKSRDADPTSINPNGSSSVFSAFNQPTPHLPPNILSNSGKMVFRNKLANALSNRANIEANSEFVIVELAALLSTQPALLPHLTDILNQMKADARMPGVIQNGHSQTAQGFDNRITDVSDHSGNNAEKNLDPHEAEPGLIGDDSNAGWTTGSTTPVPEGFEGVAAGMLGFESIDKIATGFENLVASLEKSLRGDPRVQAGQDSIDGTPQLENGNDQVKPEPVSPKLTGPMNGPSGVVPSLDELPLDIDFGHESIPNPESLDQALEELMREQYEVTAASEEEGEGSSQFDEEAMERLITEGGIDITEFMKSMESESTPEVQQDQANGIDNFTESTDTDDRRELAQQLRQAGHTPAPAAGKSPQRNLEDSDIPFVATSRMSLEEINSLIADLDNGSELTPMQLGGQPTQEPQHVASSPRPPPSSPASSPPLFNPDPDTSALYTPKNVIAILKTLLEITINPENAPVPPSPTDNSSAQRGTKRSSPDSSLNSSLTKRQRTHTTNGGASGMTAATKTAINQLNGLLSHNYHTHPTHSYGSNHHNHSPPTYHSVPTTSVDRNMQTPTYIANFGTTDGMNKRLVAMKPPPYRPSGTGITGLGIGGNGGVAGVAVKRKTGEDEKKVRAMGFPPLMAGLKPKSG